MEGPDWLVSILRLGLSALLGAVIGVEREVHGKEAGLKISALVALGATLFTLASYSALRLAGGGAIDPTRIAAQVVTGVGFLGAGAIIQARGSVYGMTTAASIWIVAAIGTAVGLGFYRGALLATGLVVLVLLVLPFVERRIASARPVHSQVKARLPTKGDLAWIDELVRELHIEALRWEASQEGATVEVLFDGFLREEQLQSLLEKLRARGDISQLSVTRS
ncbi:MAG: MgtC/SapB family protein [Myxococcales bacterium]|jgi:putative Mg2+ transporter-C (MgtC) family protein